MPAQITVAAGTKTSRLVAYTATVIPVQSVRISATFNTVTAYSDVAIAASTTALISQASTSADTPALSQADTSAFGPRNTSAQLPVITAVVNAATSAPEGACSPGAAAMLIGSNLVSGDSSQVRVDVNGESVPVMAASARNVTFQCPSVEPGTHLAIALSNGVHDSNTAHVDMQEFGPGIFTIDGGELSRGAVVLDQTADLVVTDPNIKGKPAQQGDVVNVLCTGLGRTFGGEPGTTATPLVTVGGVSAQVLSAVSIAPGIYEVAVQIPEAASIGNTVPLQIQMPGADGHLVDSNRVYISLDRPTAAE